MFLKMVKNAICLDVHVFSFFCFFLCVKKNSAEFRLRKMWFLMFFLNNVECCLINVFVDQCLMHLINVKRFVDQC